MRNEAYHQELLGVKYVSSCIYTYCWMVYLISRLAGVCHLCEKACFKKKTRHRLQIHIGLKRCCSTWGSISVLCSYFGLRIQIRSIKATNYAKIKEGLNC